MSPMITRSSPPLREALYTLSLAKRIPDAELLDEAIRKYPQFADELTGLAVELALDGLRSEGASDATDAVSEPGLISPTVSRAISRFHNRLHAVRRTDAPGAERARASEAAVNPFAMLGRVEFRAFAGRIGANTVFVAKLRDRQIEPETIPDGFIRLVADELSAPLEVVRAHLVAAGGASPARQFYKADDKPRHPQRQSFEEAVRGSGLDEEQQQRLLRL